MQLKQEIKDSFEHIAEHIFSRFHIFLKVRIIQHYS